MTPWFAMHEIRGLKAGDSVLIQGTGGVSIFAIHLASALGARVIATSSSDEKLVRARELGATDTINYRTTPDWASAVLEMTDGEGVDVVLDVVGGDGTRDSVHAAKGNGLVAVIGFLDAQTTNLDIMDVIGHQTRIQGIAMGHLRSFRELVDFLDEHAIHPVIDSVFAFEDAPRAYDKLAEGTFGKIVINIA